jgi:murein L,D-transpeptidase YcbB/YkuD
MQKQILIFLTAVLCSALYAGEGEAATLDAPAVSAALRDRVKQMQARQHFACRSELICGVADLPLFYRRNGYRPVWLDGEIASPKVHDLLDAVRAARKDGLHPADYHLEAIEALLGEMESGLDIPAVSDVQMLVDLEVLCTDAFLLLGSHLLAGRVNPETLYAKWLVADPQADFAAILQQAVDDGRIAASLQQLLPPHSGYAALKKELARYRRLAVVQRWAPIPAGPPIRIGDRDHRVPDIRRRLQTLGDLPAAGGSDRYDPDLAAAVRRFQRRHGLKPDAVIGRRTLAALNVTPARRVKQIELNLERWRWIPHDLGRRHLLVNIADYSLTAVESGRPVMRMRVVVGHNYRRTPVFSDRLETIVINPYWNVPTRLAVEDLLPRIQKDPDYLARNDFSVFAGWKKGARELDPDNIDWSRVTEDNFWYRLRQNPGPKNTLGRMKFLFPNRFAVYLHDTPSRQLFAQSQRGFSSGCIRVERPFDLAQYLIESRPSWDREKIRETVDGGQRTVVRLSSDVKIHIMYWTAWVDRNGALQFRDDIYERDEPLAVALRQRPPRGAAIRQAMR